MIAMYIPGHSVLHRCPAVWKLLLLFIIGATLAYPSLPLWLVTTLTALCILSYCISGLGARVFLRQLWIARWIIAFTFFAQVWFKPILATMIVTTRITTIILCAALVTLTTSISAILAVILQLLKPLQRYGINTNRIGVALSLAISVIAIISSSMKTVREASRARGIRTGLVLGVQTWAVPLMVLVLKQADEIADSLDARGV